MKIIQFFSILFNRVFRGDTGADWDAEADWRDAGAGRDAGAEDWEEEEAPRDCIFCPLKPPLQELTGTSPIVNIR